MKEVDIETGGIAKQTNPSPVLDGQRATPLYDDIGRQAVVLHHVRDLITTAIASVTSGTQATLLSGESGAFFDLAYLTASNSSDAAYQVTLKDDGTTVHTLQIPGEDTIEMNPSIPIPQSAKGGDWQVDLEDLTGGTVNIEAIFIKNV